MKYILVYFVNGYCEEGGGDQVEFLEDSEHLDKRVEEILMDGHELIAAGELKEYKYKTVEVIKKVVRD